MVWQNILLFTKALFDSKGVRCTHYIVTDWVDTAGYMTVANLQTLDAGGMIYNVMVRHIQVLTH